MFAAAIRRRSRLRLALTGPSGSGKTWSALAVATGLGGRVALIDTERRSAALYSDAFAFDVAELDPPYSPARYREAIEASERAGYDVLIIDSLSHAWAGEGGILETVDAVQARGGNKFTAWGPAGREQNALIGAILGARSHVIATLRAKQEYAIEVDARGKQSVRKLGLAPVQRDGVEYEFGIVLDLGMDHAARVGLAGKDRSGLFAAREPAPLSADDGARLAAWLDQGEAPIAPVVTPADVRQGLRAAMDGGGWTADDVRRVLARWSVERAADLPAEVCAEALTIFRGPPPAPPQE